MDEPLIDDVSGWLMALSTLVAGKLNLDEIRLRLGSYVPLLVQEFPNHRYFTSETLRYVARHSKWFPSYGELCDLLTAAWKQNGPAIAAPVIRARAVDHPIQPAPEWCFDRTIRHARTNDEFIPPVDEQPRGMRAIGAILRGEKAE